MWFSSLDQASDFTTFQRRKVKVNVYWSPYPTPAIAPPTEGENEKGETWHPWLKQLKDHSQDKTKQSVLPNQVICWKTTKANMDPKAKTVPKLPNYLRSSSVTSHCPHHTPPNDHRVAPTGPPSCPSFLLLSTFHDHCPNLDTIRLLKQPTNKSLATIYSLLSNLSKSLP